MGVFKLWNILSSAGRQTNLDQLGKKRLAIDTSIWLNKFIKAMRDQQGNLVPNAHIKGMVSRILKLLQYGIRPVFIFDGATPAIKRRTTLSRRKIREQSETKLRKVAQQLLINRIKQQAVLAKSAIGVEAARELEKQIEGLAASSESVPVRPASGASNKEGPIDVDIEGANDFSQFLDEGEFDESFNASNASFVDEFESIRNEITSNALEYAEDLTQMNIDQEVFASLPPRVQMEIIADIKRAKQARTKALVRKGSFKSPNPSHFSEVQVQNLISSGDLTRKLIRAREAMSSEAQPIASDPNAKYILIRTTDKKSEQKSSPIPLTTTPASDKSQESLTTPNAANKSSDSDKKRKTMSEPIDVDDDEEILLEDRRKRRRKSDSHLDQVKKKLDFAEGAADLASEVILPNIAEDGELDITVEFTPVPIEDQARSAGRKKEGSQNQTQNRVDVDTDGGFIISDEESHMDHSPIVDLTASPVKQKSGSVAYTDTAKNIDGDKEARNKDQINLIDITARVTPIHNNTNVIPRLEVNDLEQKDEDNEVLSVSLNSLTSTPAKPNQPAQSTPARASVNTKPVDVSLFGKTQITVDLAEDEDEEIAQNILNDIHNYEEFLDEEEKNALVISSGEDDDKSIYSVEDYEMPQADLEEDEQVIESDEPIQVEEETGDIEIPEINNSNQPVMANNNNRNANTHGNTEAAPKRNINEALMAHAGIQNTNNNNNRVSGTKRDTRRAVAENSSDFTFSDRNSLSDAQFATLQREIRSESTALANQRQQLARDAQGVTDEMINDCKEILELFGIPYLVSATESDSQCAILEEFGLVDGVITDDSDVFLFGAKNVYRHVFEYEKPAEAYSSVQIESELGLTRKELICLAYLLGSDYTSGVKGIGVISAAEIIEEFCSVRDSKIVTAEEVIEDLNRFKTWLQSPNDAEHNDTDFKKRHKNLKSKLKLADDFPNIEVAEAYISPQVDDSKEPFEWSIPNLDALRYYVMKKLEWPMDRANEKLMAVIQKYNSIVMSQATLTSYFKPNLRIESKIKSERLSAALSDLATKRQEMKENSKKAVVEEKQDLSTEKTPEKNSKTSPKAKSAKKKSPASDKPKKKSPRSKAKK